MDTIAFATTLTLDDWRALQGQCAGRMARTEKPVNQWLRIVAFVAVLTVVVLATSDLLGIPLDGTSVVVALLVLFVAMMVNARITQRRLGPSSDGLFLGPCTYDLDAAGLRSGRADAHSFCAWRAVVDVTRSDTHVFVWVDRFSAYVIPCRELPGGLTAMGLAEWIAAARAGAVAQSRPVLEAGAPLAQRAVPPARPIGARLLDLVNLVALRGKPVLTEPSQGWVATLLTLLAVGTWVAFNRWEYGPDAVFYVYDLPSTAWYLLGGLAVAWVLAFASTPRMALAHAIALCALGAWLVVLYLYLGDFLTSGWASLALLAVVTVYGFVYFAQAARAVTGQAQPRAACAAFLGALAFFWGTESLYIFPTLWVQGQTEGEGGGYDIEPLLFAQPGRVDAAVAAVEPSAPSVTEMYFLGFAGYGGQKVFAEEIKLAAEVVAARYASEAHSVLLLNDERDSDAAPLATVSTLTHAMRGVAGKMTLDDDVLFLALSSHGSDDWELSVSNGILPLTNVTPETLRAALDDAGIRWRVIVISACYAGGFIEALQDPYTIVLAAAAPDRTSFGCSDERELTYFGEAFYRDALPAAASLREAFATAERLVGERETAEGVTPSLPMAFFGEELERKLTTLDELTSH